jgi:hypothetical protein
MENALPTVVIVLAEIITILVIALGVALYLYVRKNKRHRYEINAVMDIARHAEMSPPARDRAVQTVPVDAEFIARTNQSIGDIREAIARLDLRLVEIHNEDQLRNKEINHRIEEENTQFAAVREELQALTSTLHELKAQNESLEQELRNQRNMLEQHAQHEAETEAKTDMKPSPRGVAHLVDDFSLPDSVLAEMEELAKSAGAPTTATSAASVTANKPELRRTTAQTQKRAQLSQTASREDAVMVKNGTVDEPQYAFDPARIDDSFNVPYFIPGAANTGINVEELDFEDLNLESPPTPADTPNEQPHFHADRVFYQASPQTGIKAGWYFTLRGGKAHGPFGSKEASERVLSEMIEHFKRNGDAGGR